MQIISKKTSMLILFCVAAILLSYFVSAAYSSYGLDVSYTPVKTEIMLNEPAEFIVVLTNLRSAEERFRVTVPDIEWSVATEPEEYRLSGLMVKPNSSVSFRLLIYPAKGQVPGQKAAKVIARTDSGDEEIRKYLKINIRSQYVAPSYAPDVRIEAILPNEGKIDPRDESKIKVEVKNKNPLKLENINVKIKSSFFENTNTIESLGPLEKTSIEFSIKPDPQEAPKKDLVIITAEIENKTFVAVKEIEVIPYYLPFTTEIKTSKYFLKRVDEITAANPGNAEKEDVVKIESSLVKSLVTSTEPASKVIKEDGKRYLSWTLTLNSQQSKKVYVTTNYRPTWIIIILILIGAVVYYIFRSPIVIQKSVKDILVKDGGISELKVKLNIKNRGNNHVSHIEIFDKIPNIADLKKEHEPGTIAPLKVMAQEKKGTIVKWELDSLEGKEERVISYKVKARLSILGVFTLPRAVAKFKNKNGTSMKTSSNIVSLSGEK